MSAPVFTTEGAVDASLEREAERPLLSLVTVCLDNLEGLRRTAASVRKAWSSELEYVVVDGGSKDGTCEFLAGLADPPCRSISEKDRGIYEAMNKGLRLARGRYVMFLNAGDALIPSGLAEALEELRRDDGIDVLRFDALREDGTLAERFRGTAALRFDSVGCHQAYIVRTSLHRGTPFDTRYRIKGDRDVLLRLYRKGCRFVHRPRPLVLYEGTGVSERLVPRKELENCLVTLRRREWLPGLPLSLGLAAVRLTFFILSHLVGVSWSDLKATLRFGRPREGSAT